MQSSPWMRAVVLVAVALVVADTSAFRAAQDDDSSPEATRALIDDGKYLAAEAMARRLVDESKARSGPQSGETAAALDLLVEALWRAGKAAEPEAVELAERAVAIKETLYGLAHAEVAKSLNSQANLLRKAGLTALAKPAYERALAIREKELDPEHIDTAQTLHNFASLKSDLFDFESARRDFERALAIREKRLGPRHRDVAATLSSLGNLLRKMKQDREARELLERACGIQEVAIPFHPDLAKGLQNLAALLFDTGELREARERYERALYILERTSAPRADLATTLGNYGAVLRQLGNHAEAERVLRRALELAGEQSRADSVRVATTLNNLGGVLMETGIYDKAREALERAVALRERIRPDEPGLVPPLINLAILSLELGDLDTAQSLRERAQSILDARNDDKSRETASNYALLARLERELGDERGAAASYERALAIAEAALGPDAPLVADILVEEAGLHSDRGEFERALKLQSRARAIREAFFRPEHLKCARSLVAVAELLLKLERPAEARPLLDRALTTLEGVLGPVSADAALALTQLGHLERHAGDFAEAEARYQRALEIDQAALGKDHRALAADYRNIAEARLRLGDLDGALDAARRGEEVRRKDLALTAKTLSDRQALRFVSRQASALDLALAVAARTTSVEARRKAWDTLVRSRAIVLDEMAARRALVGDDAETEGIRVSWLEASRRVATLVLSHLDHAPADPLRDEVERAEERLDEIERQLAQRSPRFRAAQERRAVSLQDVAAALPPRSALVAFASFERAATGAPGSYLAFVLTAGRGDPAVVTLGATADIEVAAENWRRLASSPPDPGDRSRADDAFRAAGATLRRLVWDPLEKYVTGVQQVFVVPDGALQLVNLSALPSRTGIRRFVVETGPPIHLLVTERDLVHRPEDASQGTGLLAVGGVDFGSTTAIPSAFWASRAADGAPVPGPRHFRGGLTRCRAFSSLEFAPLPATAREVEQISALWEYAVPLREVKTLRGAEATETAFLDGARGKRIVHLATHGFFLDDCLDRRDVGQPIVENPLLLSGIVLAGANRRGQAKRGDEDGILTAEEIAAADLRGVDWAVLSTCESGLGAIRKGEGVLGLRRAFDLAGAHATIMSLWKVDDAATARWMSALYTARLARGMSTAASVRHANLQVLKERRGNGDSTHPFYWGAFVAAGDWR